MSSCKMSEVVDLFHSAGLSRLTFDCPIIGTQAEANVLVFITVDSPDGEPIVIVPCLPNGNVPKRIVDDVLARISRE